MSVEISCSFELIMTKAYNLRIRTDQSELWAYFEEVTECLLYKVNSSVYRNMKWVNGQWSSVRNFLIYEPQWFYCFHIWMFQFRYRNNYFFGHQKMENSNVCVLPGKNKTYGEKLMVYRYSLVKRQPLERTNNVSSKKIIQLAFARVLYAN